MSTPASARQRCLFGLLFLFLVLCVDAQEVPVYGCKDPTALNYSLLATIDNNSCKYQKKVYTPPQQKFDSLSVALKETSGLQWAGNNLWSFNDGGNPPVLFRIDTTSDAILQTVLFENATNVDWEDIAFDGTYFYIGDFGNNTNGARADLKIYKFPLNAIPASSSNDTVTVPASAIEIISFTYSDQPLPLTSAGVNNTKYDCEAMIVDGGKIHLFTKNWIDKTTTHYVINSLSAGNHVATPLETLATTYLVTAADKVPGTNTIILLGYQNSGLGDHFLTVLSNYTNGFYFNGVTRHIDLPSALEMGQAEGITFRNSSYGYISNEWFHRTVYPFPTFTAKQRLFNFNMAAFAGDLVLPLSLLHFEVTPANGVHRIDWRFSEPVQELKIEHSQNGESFTTMQTFRNQKSGQYQFRPTGGKHCYRLVWKNAGGREKYSSVVCKETAAKSSLANLVLSANGQLQVVNNGNRPADYRAKLFSVDGRTVAPAERFTFNPGLNKVRFANQLNRHAILFLQMRNETEEITKLLRVE